jgi:hypothetical protein
LSLLSALSLFSLRRKAEWKTIFGLFKQIMEAKNFQEIQAPILPLFNAVKAIQDDMNLHEVFDKNKKAELKEKMHNVLQEKAALRKTQKTIPKCCACGRGKVVKVCINCLCGRNNRSCNKNCGCNADGKECQLNLKQDDVVPIQEEIDEIDNVYFIPSDEEMEPSTPGVRTTTNNNPSRASFHTYLSHMYSLFSLLFSSLLLSLHRMRIVLSLRSYSNLIFPRLSPLPHQLPLHLLLFPIILQRLFISVIIQCPWKWMMKLTNLWLK